MGRFINSLLVFCFCAISLHAQESAAPSAADNGASTEKSIQLITPDWNEFYVKFRHGLNSETKLFIDFGFSNGFGKYGISSYSFYGGHLRSEAIFTPYETHPYDNTPEITLEEKQDNVVEKAKKEQMTILGRSGGIKYNIGVGFPIAFDNKFCLNPYFTPGLALGLTFYQLRNNDDGYYDAVDEFSYYGACASEDVTFDFMLNLETGVRFGWLIDHSDTSRMLYVGLNYSHEWVTKQALVSRGYAGMSLGFCF